MTTVGILYDLASHGVTVEAIDGRLRLQPREAVTAKLAEQVREHKGKILEFLQRQGGDASADPFVGWVEWVEADGRQVLCHPDYVEELFAPDVAPLPAEREASPPAKDEAGCDRCGSVRIRDIEIHGGESLRRDCVKCHAFHSFPVWYGATGESA